MKIYSLVIRESCEDHPPPDGNCVCRTLLHNIFINEKNMINEIFKIVNTHINYDFDYDVEYCFDVYDEENWECTLPGFENKLCLDYKNKRIFIKKEIMDEIKTKNTLDEVNELLNPEELLNCFVAETSFCELNVYFDLVIKDF